MVVALRRIHAKASCAATSIVLIAADGMTAEAGPAEPRQQGRTMTLDTEIDAG